MEISGRARLLVRGVYVGMCWSWSFAYHAYIRTFIYLVGMHIPHIDIHIEVYYEHIYINNSHLSSGAFVSRAAAELSSATVRRSAGTRD